MNFIPTPTASAILNRPSTAVEICLLIANPANERELSDLMVDSGYRVTRYAAANLAHGVAGGALLITDETSAMHHQAALLGLKEQLQPLYFPMLLTLTGTTPATPWLRAGFDDVLRLPMNSDDLLARIQTFLRLRLHSEQIVDASMAFRASVDLAPVGVANLSADGHLLFHNARFCDMFGLGGHGMHDADGNLTIYDILHPDDVTDTQQTIAALFAGTQASGHKTDKRYCRRDGEVVLTTTSFSLVRNSRQQPQHIAVVVEDITARVTGFPGDGIAGLMTAHENVTHSRSTQDALPHLSRTDTPTGLPDRAMLQERLAGAIAQASRLGRPVWTVFLGMDRFGLAVQTLGHRAGDQILCTIASRLESSVRKNDIVACVGGEQFALILGQAADDTQSLNLLTRILALVAQPIPIEGQEFFLSCSMGIAIYPHDGNDPHTLLDRANTAMYRAKALGRNNFHFYTAAMDNAARDRLRLEQELRRAVEREEFVLHYQPQVDLCTGAIVGVEALIRWLHPERGLMAPDTFIATAEETGLILPIGDWVIRTACRQASAWQRAGLGPIRMAVNLSARQFIQKDLADRISATLEETGLDARLLDVELTETVVMENVDDTICILHQLKKLGVQLSVDDFGTGYSSLSNLKRFPIDVLKIDRSFVSDVTLVNDDGAIPNAIIAMAHSLGIRVIAEGVETEIQCQFLSRNMCDEIQGYWFSRPLAPDGVAALLREAKCLPAHLLRMQKAQRVLLLVDDEQNVISALRRMLRRDGYQILAAGSGREGLDVLEKNKVDVILSDQRMPGMTGVEFLRNVKTLYPETVRIVLSGFTELQSVTDAVNEGAIYKFLTKPWDDIQLREHVREAFQHKEMADENRRLALEVRSANYGLAQANRQLGDLLQQQLQQISRDEITLEIVREALQHVPAPMIGLDDDGLVAFANLAAQQLYAPSGSILGTHAENAMPEVLQAMGGLVEGEQAIACVDGRKFEITYRSMGHGTASRGMLITMTPIAQRVSYERDRVCSTGTQGSHA